MVSPERGGNPRGGSGPANRGTMCSMPDDTPGESPLRRPPLGLSPAVPRFLLLGLCGIAVGPWPLAYWATRDARPAECEECGDWRRCRGGCPVAREVAGGCVYRPAGAAAGSAQ